MLLYPQKSVPPTGESEVQMKDVNMYTMKQMIKPFMVLIDYYDKLKSCKPVISDLEKTEHCKDLQPLTLSNKNYTTTDNN